MRRLALALGVGALIAALGVRALDTVSFDGIRELVGHTLSAATGVPIEVEGDLTFRLGLRPAFRAKSVRLGDFGRAREVELTVDARELLDGILAVTALRVVDAGLFFDLDRELLFSELAVPDDHPARLEVERAVFERLSVGIHDTTSGLDLGASFESVVVRAPGAEEPVTISMRGSSAGVVGFALTAELGSLEALLGRAAALPVTLEGVIGRVRVDGAGVVERPAELRGVDVRLTASADDLADLSTHGLDLPHVGPLAAQARLVDRDGSLGLEEIEVRLGPVRSRLEGRVVGVVDDLIPPGEFDLAFQIDAADPALLGRLIGPELADDLGKVALAARLHDDVPPAGPGGGGATPIAVEVAGNVRGANVRLTGRLGSLADLIDADDAYPVELEGRLRGADVRARGSVARPLALEGFDVAVAAAAPDLTWISGSALELFDLGPVVAHGHLNDADGTLGIDGVEATIGAPDEPLFVRATADIGHLSAWDEIAFDLHLDARDLTVLGALFDSDWPPIGPVSLVGKARGSDESLDLQDVDGRLGRTHLSGTASLSFAPGERPRIDARLRSPSARLADLGIDPAGWERRRARSAEQPWRLPTELPDLDARVSLEATRISGRRDLFIDSLRATVLLERGHAALERVDVGFAEGSIEGEAHLRTGSGAPAASVRGRFTGVSLERLLAQFQDPPAVTGDVEGRFDLEGRGPTLADLRGALEGDVLVVARGGTASSAYARALEMDLAQAILSPEWKRRDHYKEIECLIGRFDLRGGEARIGQLWFETDEVVVAGRGHIDLRRGRFDVTVEPEPKKPGLVSVAASVRVSGPLARPRFEPLGGSIAASAAGGFFESLRRKGAVLLDGLAESEEPLGRSPCDPVGRAVTLGRASGS